MPVISEAGDRNEAPTLSCVHPLPKHFQARAMRNKSKRRHRLWTSFALGFLPANERNVSQKEDGGLPNWESNLFRAPNARHNRQCSLQKRDALHPPKNRSLSPSRQLTWDLRQKESGPNQEPPEPQAPPSVGEYLHSFRTPEGQVPSHWEGKGTPRCSSKSARLSWAPAGAGCPEYSARAWAQAGRC